jgi:hypothetical protein
MSVQEKLDLINKVDATSTFLTKKIAEEFGISVSTLNTVVSNSE